MTPAETRQLAALKTGLAFASPARRPEIRAMIDRLLSGDSGGIAKDAEARPSDGCLEPPARRVERAATLPRPSLCRGEAGRSWAFREHRSMAEVMLAEAPVGDWRAARRRLREAGHEVKQFDGQVYVDGQPSDDPALRAMP